jgi:xylulokinase
MTYSLGIDLGTSGVKIILASTQGKIIKETSKTYPIHYPQPGWVEQHPDDWWDSIREGLQDLLKDVDTTKIIGLGVSGQMHGLVAMDKNGTPLMPSILWNDQRSYEETEYLNIEVGKDYLIKLTGNIAFPGFTAPKVLWVRKHLPHLFNQIRYICLPKDYINYKLTGQLFTDVSDASGTLYFDVKNRKWSQEMLQLLNLEETMLPKVYESYEVAGEVMETVSQEIGIPLHTPVIAGGGDNAAGAIGANVIEEGTVMVSLGTSGVVFAPKSLYVADPKARLHTFCDGNTQWHVMGVILSAASTTRRSLSITLWV